MSKVKSRKGEQEIVEVLNSIEALCDTLPCGCENQKQVMELLGSYLETEYQNVHSWIKARRYSPGAATFKDMERWNLNMLAALNASERITYRKALAGIKKERQ